VHCTYEDVGNIFPQVIWHTETPVLRTAPAPCFTVTTCADNGFKVVLTVKALMKCWPAMIFSKKCACGVFGQKPGFGNQAAALQAHLHGCCQPVRWTVKLLKAFFKKGLAKPTPVLFPFHSLEQYGAHYPFPARRGEPCATRNISCPKATRNGLACHRRNILR